MSPPVTLLDGGLSTALAERGVDLDHHLWTARLLVEDPEVLVAAHRDFVDAGAEVLITASYQASRRGFAALGRSAGEADDALRATTALARRAAAGTGVLVAASVGPYGAILADGSEYTGRYPVGGEALVAFHAERLAVLVDSAPDLLAVETLPSAAEAGAVAEAARRVAAERAEPARPAWVSFTCASAGHTAAGDPVEAAAHAALAMPGLVAVGVNCTAPAHVAPLLRRIRSVTSLPLVAYPNRGQAWDAATNRWSGAAEAGGDVDAWIEAGARWVGGCCGTGPADIAELRRRLDR